LPATWCVSRASTGGAPWAADYRVASALANTDRLMNDAFWVGVYPGLTDEMVDFMGQRVAAAVGGP